MVVYSVSSGITSMLVALNYQLGLSAPWKLIIILLVVFGDNWYDGKWGRSALNVGWIETPQKAEERICLTLLGHCDFYFFLCITIISNGD